MPTRDQIRQLLSLSPRERQVLSLVCEGLLYKEIAGRLEIKVSTVKAYMGRVFVKFGMEFFERKERYHYLKINI